MIKIEMIGDDRLIAHLGELPAKIHTAIFTVMAKLGLDLKNIVVDQNLSGAVLQRRSGTLAGAQNLVMTDTDTIVTAQVGFNKNTAVYGVFHEYGVAKSWLITAVRAKMLRFDIPAYSGNFVFRKSVVHPPLPERSFLRSALAQIAPRVKPELEAAIAGAMR